VSAPAPGALDALMVQLSAAINTRALYAAGHPRVAAAVQGVVEAVTRACAERREEDVTFLIVGDDLVVDQRPLRAGGLFQQGFVATLRRRGVERLTLARGLTAGEAAGFVEAMAEGRLPDGSDHVVVGHVEVATAEDQGGGGPQPVTAKQLDEAREGFARFRSDRRGSVHRLEETVWSLMETMARSSRDAILLAPLKSHDDYTFVHSVNVSLLVLAQARSFGLQGPLLHSFGLAAACHDIGKLEIPIEILCKPGRLEGAEWDLMASHAQKGAWRLADTANAPPLAVVVAYEHHMRFDGRPSYPLVTRPVQPALASRMTSLADTYDAVCTLRPYAAPQARAAGLAILRDRAGSWLDPQLVGNFHRLLGAPLPA
jgi:HD-GYP domain-containing protein (c-di-GMP phosphodiesterase class II)